MIPRRETTGQWPHLRDVANKLPPYYKDAEIGLLIGLNCPGAMKPKKVVCGGDADPWAVQTNLGWTVVVSISDRSEGSECFRVSVGQENKACHFAFRTVAKKSVHSSS